MAVPRVRHTATLVPATADRGPRVLVVGGVTRWFYDQVEDILVTGSVELFDPETRTFEATGALNRPRAQHAAVRLATGEVLVVGGSGDGNASLDPSAELWEPSTGQWRAIAAPTASGS